MLVHRSVEEIVYLFEMQSKCRLDLCVESSNARPNMVMFFEFLLNQIFRIFWQGRANYLDCANYGFDAEVYNKIWAVLDSIQIAHGQYKYMVQGGGDKFEDLLRYLQQCEVPDVNSGLLMYSGGICSTAASISLDSLKIKHSKHHVSSEDTAKQLRHRKTSIVSRLTYKYSMPFLGTDLMPHNLISLIIGGLAAAHENHEQVIIATCLERQQVWLHKNHLFCGHDYFEQPSFICLLNEAVSAVAKAVKEPNIEFTSMLGWASKSLQLSYLEDKALAYPDKPISTAAPWQDFNYLANLSVNMNAEGASFGYMQAHRVGTNHEQFNPLFECPLKKQLALCKIPPPEYDVLYNAFATSFKERIKRS